MMDLKARSKLLRMASEEESMAKRFRFLDMLIDNLTMDETLQRIETIIERRIPTQHVVLNASKVVMARRDQKLAEIINHCGLVNADGQSVVWAARWLGMPLKERVAGIDLMLKLIELAAQNRYRIYFFGAKEEVVTKVVEHFKNRYPELIVAGYRNGYFSEGENVKIAEEIRRAKPDILFVGFSSPKKEQWLAENMNRCAVPFCMGVGGSFDVVAGAARRAPKWMQHAGLEWFYRFIQEPRRMWRRYLIGNTIFVYYTIMEKIKRKR